MGSMSECIEAALAQGKISRDVAKMIRESSNPMGVVDELSMQISRQRREAAIQAYRIAQRWDDITGHPEGKKTGIMAVMVKDATGKAGYANVDMRRRYYEHKYHSMVADFLAKYRSRMTVDPTKGFISYDDEAMNQLTRAIYGEPTDDPFAAAFAKQYAAMIEQMRADFNRLGGSIHKNERYLMPQNHDARTIMGYGKEQWLADIQQWIDPRYMTDDSGKVLSPAELLEGLEYAYESITTNGLNKAKDFSAPIKLGKKMSRRGSEKRFLFFKDAASWTAYQNKYGRGDVFQTLTSGINDMANDVANMELWGTNPRSAFDALVQQIEKEDGAMKGLAKSSLEAVFKVSSGTIDQGHLTTLADFMQSTRNLITASRLGRAVISALSDEGFNAITAGYNNLPLAKMLATKGKFLGMSSEEHKIFAAKIGLGADSWVRANSSANRYGDVYQVGMTGKAAEVVMRASGLEPWTDAGRKAFTMEFSAYLAENFGKSFAELDPKTLRGFKSYGITEKIWDAFRKSETLEHDGARYANMLADGGEKFHQMIMSEVDYAIPTPDSRVRAATTLGYATGSVGGQLWRSIANLKSFPITLVTTHGMRMFYQATRGEQISYAGMMLASTTLLGALAMQAKDITSGREPRPMTDDKAMAFWVAAMAQGGGLGIFGDFLLSDVNRFGGGKVATAFGPTGQIIESSIQLTFGNVQEAFKGEDTNWSLEAMNFIEQNTPSIWQIQPLKNAMFDQLTLLVDPKAQKKFNQARKKRKKEYGQDYWWGPGEALPGG